MMDHDELDDAFPLGEGTADMEADVTCPYCGEEVTIGLDPDSGSVQSYVEDCEVCCRPWQVHVHYHEDGSAQVDVRDLNE